MRKEAKKIYDQLAAGKKVSEIQAGFNTKSRVNRKFLYRKLVAALCDDMNTQDYYLDSYQLKRILKEREEAKSRKNTTLS